MTETRKTVKKTAKPKRDAYDDFLDMVESKEKPKKTSSGKKAVQGKNETAGAKKTGSSARKKSAQVEPGIVALEGKKKTAAADKAATAPKKKTARKKTEVVENPVARKRSEEPGKQPSKRKNASDATRRPSPASKGTTAARKKGANPAKTAARPAGASSRKPRNAVLYVDNENHRDAYDDFLDAAEEKTPRRARKRGNGMTAALIIAISCVIGLGAFQQAQYWNFQKMRAAVERQTYYEGTTVEGIDISSMTLQQAQEYWAKEIEPKYSQRTVTLSNGAMYTSGELGYSSDYASVLTNAWGAGRSGSLEERYAMISNRQMKPVEYSVNRRAYSEEGVQACVNAVAAQVDRPAENAHIESFDMNSYTFVFAEEKAGSKLDTEALGNGIRQAMDAGGGTVELVVNKVEPKLKKADIASQYGMISSAVTNASSSNKNRLTNIRQSMKLINGTCLKPGETFSFNETVGKRTSERGFKVATAYSGGEVTEEVGGGICQVSTTLFNAAVKADLEIVERHNHSLTVAYVDKGKDAAVNWNSQDLRFTNTTDDNIYVCCFLSEDKRVRVGIFGKLLENGEVITVEGVTTGTVDFETTYQLNFAMAPGTTNVLREGKNGYTASAYKIRWDANGNQISKELLCKSRYKAVNRIIEHGPQ